MGSEPGNAVKLAVCLGSGQEDAQCPVTFSQKSPKCLGTVWGLGAARTRPDRVPTPPCCPESPRLRLFLEHPGHTNFPCLPQRHTLEPNNPSLQRGRQRPNTFPRGKTAAVLACCLLSAPPPGGSSDPGLWGPQYCIQVLHLQSGTLRPERGNDLCKGKQPVCGCSVTPISASHWHKGSHRRDREQGVARLWPLPICEMGMRRGGQMGERNRGRDGAMGRGRTSP